MRFHEVICLNYAGLPNVPLMRLVSGSEHSKQIALMDGDGSFVSTLSVDVKELMVVLALSFKSPLRLAPPGRVGEAWPVCVPGFANLCTHQTLPKMTGSSSLS
jgi:hypothetical protein